MLLRTKLHGKTYEDLNSGAKAACSVHGSASRWRNESASADFHQLRQGFIPPDSTTDATKGLTATSHFLLPSFFFPSCTLVTLRG